MPQHHVPILGVHPQGSAITQTLPISAQSRSGMFITPGCPKQPPGHPHPHGHSPLGLGNPALHQVQVFLGGPLYLREMFREEGVAMRQAPPRHCWCSCALRCRGQTLPVLAAPTSTAGLSPCRVTKPEGFCSWGAHQTWVSVLPGGLVQLQELLWLPAGCWCPPQPHGQRQGVVLRHPAPPTPTQGGGDGASALVPSGHQDHAPQVGRGFHGLPFPTKTTSGWGKLQSLPSPPCRLNLWGDYPALPYLQLFLLPRTFFFFNAF